MNKQLIMLPEAYTVSNFLCKYLFSGDNLTVTDLLILKKQRAGLEPIIKEYPFNRVYELNEKFYGDVTDSESKSFFLEKIIDPYDKVFFPLNTFASNIFLVAGVLGREVIMVNATLFGDVPDEEVPHIRFSIDEINSQVSIQPWKDSLDTLEGAMRSIIETLSNSTETVNESNERPGIGIIHGYGHEIENFCRYAMYCELVRDSRVLDVGGGIGYGSFILSHFAKEVAFLDYSTEAVDFVNSSWAALSPNITAIHADATKFESAPLEPHGFDVIVMLDVLEHFFDPGAILSSAAELLSTNGLIVLATPEVKLFPYKICPVDRAPGKLSDVDEGQLLTEAIWPWHVVDLSERYLAPIIEASGYEILDRSYLTYTGGYDMQARLLRARDERDHEKTISLLNTLSDWKISDFSLTSERDPYFTSSCYNLTLKRS